MAVLRAALEWWHPPHGFPPMACAPETRPGAQGAHRAVTTAFALTSPPPVSPGTAETSLSGQTAQQGFPSAPPEVSGRAVPIAPPLDTRGAAYKPKKIYPELPKVDETETPIVHATVGPSLQAEPSVPGFAPVITAPKTDDLKNPQPEELQDLPYQQSQKKLLGSHDPGLQRGVPNGPRQAHPSVPPGAQGVSAGHPLGAPNTGMPWVQPKSLARPAVGTQEGLGSHSGGSLQTAQHGAPPGKPGSPAVRQPVAAPSGAATGVPSPPQGANQVPQGSLLDPQGGASSNSSQLAPADLSGNWAPKKDAAQLVQRQVPQPQKPSRAPRLVQNQAATNALKAAKKAELLYHKAKGNEAKAMRNVEQASAYAATARAAAVTAKTAKLSAIEAADRQVADILGYAPTTADAGKYGLNPNYARMEPMPVISSQIFGSWSLSALCALRQVLHSNNETKKKENSVGEMGFL